MLGARSAEARCSTIFRPLSLTSDGSMGESTCRIPCGSGTHSLHSISLVISRIGDSRPAIMASVISFGSRERRVRVRRRWLALALVLALVLLLWIARVPLLTWIGRLVVEEIGRASCRERV